MTDTLLFVGDLQNDLTVLAGLRDRPEHLVLLGDILDARGPHTPQAQVAALTDVLDLVEAGRATLLIFRAVTLAERQAIEAAKAKP